MCSQRGSGVDERSNFFLDDDDEYKEEKIRRVREVVQTTGLQYVHNHQYYIDVSGNKIARLDSKVLIYELFQPKEYKHWRNERELTSLWLKFPTLHHNLSSIVVKRDRVLANDYVLSKMRSSIDWAITALSYNGGIHVPERLTFYRVGSGVTSVKGGGKGELERLIKAYERELESKKTFLKYASITPNLEELLKFDIYLHNAYLSFLKGKEFEADLREYMKFLRLRNRALVPFELSMQVSLRLSKRLYRFESWLTRKFLSGFV